MRLRSRFILYAVFIHLALAALSLLLLPEHRYFFVGAEALVLASIAFSVHLYRSLVTPLELISAGVESIKDKDFSTTFLGTGQQELDQLIDTYNRMIGELRNERIKQKAQHYFLQRLIEATPQGVVILDLENKIEMINPAAWAMLGDSLESPVGRPLASFATSPGRDLAEMQAGEVRIANVSGTKTFRCTKSHFVDRGFHRHFVLIEELTREILATQKNAYDKVIRMMSHEINNSVGAVNSILDSCRGYRTQLTPEDREDFDDAVQVAIDRNIGLNKFMSNFADVVRVPEPVREPYDTHLLLRSVQTLMSVACADKGIEWNWRLAAWPLTVSMDVQQMEQVLVNVVKNAIEAIDGGGSITVETSTGPTARLVISDTGHGLAPEDRPRLFTPFFSTKRDGQGVGLTLIREILLNHGFAFGLDSNDDGGASFWIDFGDPAKLS